MEDMSIEHLKQKINSLTTESFLLKRKIEEMDENNSLLLLENTVYKINYKTYSSLSIDQIFEKICFDYVNFPQHVHQLTKIQGGESLKKLFKLIIDDVEYLFVDFSFAEETAEHFVKITQHYSDSNFCLPKVCYWKNNFVITEYINGQTMEFISLSSVRYKLIQEINIKCVDWILSFKKTDCDLIDKNTSYEHWRQVSKNKLTSLAQIAGHNQYDEKIIRLVDNIYSKSKSCMCHNDFMPANIMWDDIKHDIRIVDYHDCDYNLEHYDIASLLYSPKKYFSDKDREVLLSYYYERLENKPEYSRFISDIICIGFIRMARSLDLRFKKLLHKKQNNPLLLMEIRRGLNCMKSLEVYVDIYICDNLEKLLPKNDIISVTLCAGFGKRMGGDLPKCATPLLGIPMIEYVVNSLNSYTCSKNIYVVGYKKDVMINAITISSSGNIVYVDQQDQLGTGHAVIQTIPHLPDNKTVLVCMGDMPVITVNMIMNVITHHKESKAVTTVVSAKLKTENRNGKIIKDNNGEFQKIVEFKDIDLLYSENDANIIKQYLEVNTGLYVFESTELKKYLTKLDNKNAQSEYYLTDIIKLQKQDKLKVDCFLVNDMCEPTGANDRDELMKIEEVFSIKTLY